MNDTLFDKKRVLHELKHYLPSQTPLKDFIHHNSLHAFQGSKFYEAIFKSSKIFGHQSTMPLTDYRKLFEIGRIRIDVLEKVIENRKGNNAILEWKNNLVSKKYDDHVEQRIGILRAHWKQVHHIDLDNLVQPFLFRFLCSYLDQGISIWDFPIGNKSFLESIIELEKNSFGSIFKTKRAQTLLFQESISIENLLKIIVGNEAYYEQYIFDQQFSHRGWSGLVASVESQPNTLLSPKQISLNDLIIFELLLEIDNLDNQLGNNWKPLADTKNQSPINLFEEIENTELQEVLKIWQDAFEWSYYDQVLAGIQQLSVSKKKMILLSIHQNHFRLCFA